MGVRARFEVENGQYLPLYEGLATSKALAPFLQALHLFCDQQLGENTNNGERGLDSDMQYWFANIQQHMTQDLCLLSHAWFAQWDYNPNEYERYLAEHRDYPRDELFSRDQFRQECERRERAWTDLALLRKMFDSLLQALEVVKPTKTWYYDPTDSLADLYRISRALWIAQNDGHKQVRIYIT